MTAEQNPFLRALHRHLWIWRTGVLLASLLRLLRLALLIGLAAVAADLVFALSPLALRAVDLAAVGGMLFFVLWEAINCLAPSLREAAERADRLSANPRQPVLSAFELQRAAPGANWGRYLVERSLSAGTAALAGVRWQRAFPWPECARQSRWLLAVLVPCLGLLLWQPRAMETALARLAHPDGERPPFSSYRFQVAPDPVQVLYGGSVELTVDIAGAPVRQPVVLRTRKGDQMDESICFRQGDTVFSQRLEKVVDALEFCFAVGRARSPWQPIGILLQPKVALVKLAIEPPAYTGMAASDTVLSQEKIEGYGGSKAHLQLTSNRPLSTGVLTLVPLDGAGETRSVVGRKAGVHTVAFDWELQFPARVEIRVEDVQGTTMAEPLRLTQKLIPDRVPEATIGSPAAYTLATPGSTVRIQGNATDDLALRGVSLVRTIAGYRDRSLPLGPLAAERQYSFQQDLSLARIGVLPGQIIELFLEAKDHNPERLGVGASEIVRLEIISNEEYAEIVRSGETLDQLAARYGIVEAEFAAFQQTITDLAAELQKASPDPARLEALLDQARSQNRQTRELFRSLAAEFQAYALEEGWKTALEEIAQRLEGQGEVLAGLKADSPSLAEVVAKLRQELEPAGRQLAQQKELTEDFLKAGRAMEHAARFVQILNRQRDLVRILARREADTSERGSLRELGKREAEIRQELAEFAASLARTAEALPATGDLAELRAGALDFAAKLARCGADGLLQQVVVAAQNENGPDMLRDARLGKERLEELLSQCGDSAFGGMCRGGLKFQVRDELRTSMEQMLSSMLKRGGDSKGGGQGTGNAPGGGVGDGADGYSVSAHTRMNTPVIGPARRQFVQGGGAKGGAGRGSGGPGAGGAGRAGRTESTAGQTGRDFTGPGRAAELAPEKYRQALERYFSQPEATP